MDAVGHLAVAVFADCAHDALLGAQDGREVLDVLGGNGVQHQTTEQPDRKGDAFSHVRFLRSIGFSNVSVVNTDVLLFVMYVVFIYVKKKGRQYAGLFQIVERGCVRYAYSIGGIQPERWHSNAICPCYAWRCSCG